MYDWPPLGVPPRPEHRWYDYGDQAHFGIQTYIDDHLTGLGVVTACGEVMNPAIARVAYDGAPNREPCRFCLKVHVPTAELVGTAPPGERNTEHTLKCTSCDRFLGDPMPRFRPSQADRLKLDSQRRRTQQPPPPPPSNTVAESVSASLADPATRARERATSSQRLRTAAGLVPAAIVFVVVFAVAIPVVWLGLGIAVGFAYLGTPVLEGWWQGPLGWVAQGVATVVLSGMAAAAAAMAIRGQGQR